MKANISRNPTRGNGQINPALQKRIAEKTIIRGVADALDVRRASARGEFSDFGSNVSHTAVVSVESYPESLPSQFGKPSIVVGIELSERQAYGDPEFRERPVCNVHFELNSAAQLDTIIETLTAVRDNAVREGVFQIAAPVLSRVS